MTDKTPNHSPADRTSKSGRKDPLVGRVFNERFRVQELVARGGMGKVYKAVQDPLGRVVALKVLDPKYTGEIEQNFDERFFMEASISSKLTHPNTVTIFDYGQTADGLFYIAMEYLEGRTLYRELKNLTILSIERTIHVAAQICRSVREAHQLNVVHRDLKPANVFLISHGDENDFVKVLDFGLVKNMLEEQSNMTKTGIFMGSPGYMSPEQIRGHALDKRTDVYSLGAMLFEMLTGQPPFVRATTMDTILAHLSDEVPRFKSVNPSIETPKVLEQIVRKCLAKDRNQRFESMEKVLHALKLVLKQLDSNQSISISGEPSLFDETNQLGQLANLSTDSHSRSQIGTVPGATPPPPPTSIPGLPAAPQAIGSELTPNPTIVLTDADLDSLRTPSGGHSLQHEAGKPRSTSKENNSSFMGVAIILLAFVALGGFFVFKQSPQNNPVEKAPPAKAVSTEIKPEAPAAPAAPAESPTEVATTTAAPAPPVLEDSVDVILTSSPAGASVHLGSRLLCRSTPCELTWKGIAAKPGRVVELRYELDNYRRYTASRTIRGPLLEAHARLSKIRVVRKPRVEPKKEEAKAVAKKPAVKKTPPPEEDDGYKDMDDEETKNEDSLEDYKDNPYKDNPY